MSGLPGENCSKKVTIYIVSYCPLSIWPLKTCNPDISKIIMTRSFKFDQWRYFLSTS